MNVAHDLTKDNPTAVKQWIPTGSRWLDSIICRKMAGIPGKITEIAGLSATGSLSWLHRLLVSSKMGMQVVILMQSLDPSFWEDGLRSKTIYTKLFLLKNLNTIEDLMSASPETQWLFIWDSIAATASEKDIEGDFNLNQVWL